METITQEAYGLREIGLILRKHRGVMCWTFALSLVMGLLVVFLMPPLFEAVARIEVRRESRGPGYSVRSTQPEGFSMIRNLERKEELTTESEVIKSRLLVESVVKSQKYTIEKLDAIRDFRRYVRYAYNSVKDSISSAYDETKYFLHLSHRPTPEEQRLYNWERLVADAAGRIRVEALQDSDIIELSFRSSDPVLARDAANAIALEYLRSQSESRRSKVQNFFLHEASRMADELHQKETQLGSLKRQFAAYSPEEQRRLAIQSFAQTSDALKSSTTTLAKLKARRSALQAQLAEQPEMITTSREVGRNPSLNEINTRLVELEMRRANLLQNFQDKSTAVRSLEEELAVARRLKSETANTVEGTVTGAPNPLYREIKADLLKVDADVSASEAERATLSQHVASYRAELEQLDRSDLSIRDLERRVKTQEDAYLLYSHDREQARVTDEMAVADLTEVRLIDPARLPLSPVRPKQLMYSGIVLASALLLAGFAVFLAESGDRTTSSEQEARRVFKMPVLASFPTVNMNYDEGDRMRGAR